MASEVREAGETDYSRGIRSAVRGLWTGVFDYDQFFDLMMTTIRRGLTAAWHDGASQAGVQPSELTPEERLAMERAIFEEIGHIGGLASEIEANSKANGGKLSPLMGRAEMWSNRYSDVVSKALMMARGDPKLQWVWTPEKEHCSTCTALNGKVKRQSYWNKVGVKPRDPPNPNLECKGWRCGCSFSVTTDRCSPGPLPGFPAVEAGGSASEVEHGRYHRIHRPEGMVQPGHFTG
jgi:hypothetical protein